MKPTPAKKVFRCAIYTRKSTEHNLDLEFNSLDAQREACEAYIKSQAHEGWRLIPDRYDDGGLSGASLERPALQTLLTDIRAGKIDIVVVYKVDRLTRSLADFAKLVELFDAQSVSFVSVTQSFNTTSSMGRLNLNVLLSFAQFEREVIGERVRDKIAASKRKGIWVGGSIPLGYGCVDKKVVVIPRKPNWFASSSSVTSSSARLARSQSTLMARAPLPSVKLFPPDECEAAFRSRPAVSLISFTIGSTSERSSTAARPTRATSSRSSTENSLKPCRQA